MTDKKFTILNVDDDDASCRAASGILRKAGFEVIEAARGTEAIRLVRKKPDLVILDVDLPDINGFEVCRRIRSDPATSLIPVLHVSGIYRDDQHKVIGLESGADGYLTKPMEPPVLIAYVKALLRMGEAEAELQAAAQQWRTTFDAISDTVCLMDIEGRILRCNEAMMKLLGKPFSEIVGHRCWELVHGTSEPIEGCPIPRMRESRRRETLVLPVGERWFHVSVDPLPDEAGKLMGAVHIMTDITERKRAEETFGESEEKFRAIFESVPTSMILIDKDGIMVEVSPHQVYHTARGLTPREGYVGKSLITHPTIVNAGLSDTYRRLLKGKPFDLKDVYFPSVQRGTEGYYFNIKGAPLFKEGEVIGAITVHEEITERKRAEEALRESEASLTRAQQIAHLGNWDWDVEGETLTWSDEAYRIFGVEKEFELTYEGIEAMVHPDDHEKNQEFVNELLATADSADIEFRIIRPDGAVRHIYQNAKVWRDESGNANRMFGIMQDITERKRAREELRESEQRYRAVVEDQTELLCRFLPDLTVTFVNEAYCRYFGKKYEELVGHSFMPLISPEDRREIEMQLASLSQESPLATYEHREVAADGGIRWIQWTDRALFDENDTLVEFQSVGRDITERKRVEELIRTQRDLGLALSTVSRLDEGLRLCYEAAIQVSGMDCGGFYLVDETIGALDMVFHQGLPSDFVKSASHFDADSANARLVMAGDPIYTEHLVLGVPLDEAERLEGLRAIAVLPLLHEGRVIGCLNVASHTRDEVPLYARDALETIVAQIGSTITRLRAEEALQRSLEETARGQRTLLALSQAAQAVQRARTPEEVYQTVGDEVTSLGYRATIFALTDDREHLVVAHLTFKPALLRAAEKLTGLSAQGYRFPLQPAGFLQRIIFEGETAFTAQTPEHIAEALPRPVRPLAWRVAALLGAEQSIAAPLTVGGESHGLLVVSGIGLTEADVPAMTAFANQAAIALENARLFEEVQAGQERLRVLAQQVVSAQEEERRRIAQELHDELGQALTGIVFDLAAIEKELPPESTPAIKDKLAEASSLTYQLDERVSEIALDLRPYMLDDLGLLPTLRWYVNRYTKRLNIEVEIEAMSLEERLPPQVETALYRVVQEALTNVARHAQANRVSVRLERKESTVTVFVEDDGRGFDVEKIAGPHPPERGAGLLGIRERVASLGGTFSIQSRPGQGTRLTIEIPV